MTANGEPTSTRIYLRPRPGESHEEGRDRFVNAVLGMIAASQEAKEAGTGGEVTQSVNGE